MGFGAYDEDEQPNNNTTDDEDGGEMIDRGEDADHDGDIEFKTGSVADLLQQHRDDVKASDEDDGDDGSES